MEDGGSILYPLSSILYPQCLTYRELDGRANQLAHHLRSLGVGPEVRVGLCLERSVDLIVGMLAVLKAGGAYVPLDPAYPHERLRFMLEDSLAAALVSQADLAAQLPWFQGPVVCIDRDWGAIGRLSAQGPLVGATPGNLAYVIYTS